MGCWNGNGFLTLIVHYNGQPKLISELCLSDSHETKPYLKGLGIWGFRVFIFYVSYVKIKNLFKYSWIP